MPPPSEDPDLSLQNYPRQRTDREGCVPSQTLRRSGDIRTERSEVRAHPCPPDQVTRCPVGTARSAKDPPPPAAMQCAPPRPLPSLPGSLPTAALSSFGEGGGPRAGRLPPQLPSPNVRSLGGKGTALASWYLLVNPSSIPCLLSADHCHAEPSFLVYKQGCHTCPQKELGFS